MSLTRRTVIALAAAIGLSSGAFSAYAADVLNVGSYPNNPPFEFKNADGTFEGFEVEVLSGLPEEARVIAPYPDKLGEGARIRLRDQ